MHASFYQVARQHHFIPSIEERRAALLYHPGHVDSRDDWKTSHHAMHAFENHCIFVIPEMYTKTIKNTSFQHKETNIGGQCGKARQSHTIRTSTSASHWSQQLYKAISKKHRTRTQATPYYSRTPYKGDGPLRREPKQTVITTNSTNYIISDISHRLL